MNEIAIKKPISHYISLYEERALKVAEMLKTSNDAFNQMISNSTINGKWGRTQLKKSDVTEADLHKNLLVSAWVNIYDILNINLMASAREKKAFDYFLNAPSEFTMENIREQFGEYIKNPREMMLKALAEAFCDLDPVFKSHDKMKIGVKGLPKRIIVNHVMGYNSYGHNQIENILNAIAVYQGIPLPEPNEVTNAIQYGSCFYLERGISIKTYKNKNAHIYFTPETLLDVNRALAEYYGDILPDCHQTKPEKKRESTAVSKDLQYYPTPKSVVKRILSSISIGQNDRILEPSCGCGRFMDEIIKSTKSVYGIEVDPTRAKIARDKGHTVHIANFLETQPGSNNLFDKIIMNPPFYGKHYAKHIAHAMKFLKPGGWLYAVLPITARYDHKLLPENKKDRYETIHPNWDDLPVGSFAESGTRVNTTVYKYRKMQNTEFVTAKAA